MRRRIAWGIRMARADWRRARRVRNIGGAFIQGWRHQLFLEARDRCLDKDGKALLRS